ncbi:hypothetical protein [Tsukamurella sp. NPDC003166]|uniref:hypothetical protein n=1 Tax=Tsukamurella sp. NPDC003166 TaxID=3154444 RepID=UPI0033B3B52A
MSRTSKQRRDAKKKRNRGAPKPPRKNTRAATPTIPFDGSMSNHTPTSDAADPASRNRMDARDARLATLLRFLYARVEDSLYEAMCELYEVLCPDDDPSIIYELTVPETAVAEVAVEIIRVSAGGWPDEPRTSAA